MRKLGEQGVVESAEAVMLRGTDVNGAVVLVGKVASFIQLQCCAAQVGAVQGCAQNGGGVMQRIWMNERIKKIYVSRPFVISLIVGFAQGVDMVDEMCRRKNCQGGLMGSKVGSSSVSHDNG